MKNELRCIKDESGQWVEREWVYAPMWYHLQGLQQTATGYGSKLNSGYKVFYAGRLRRIYVICYSNAGSAYVIVNGQRVII